MSPVTMPHPLATRTPNLVTVVRELPADLETPVSVYLRLAGQGPSFLLESVTGGEQIARYSFIGVNPSRAYVLHGPTLIRHDATGSAATLLPAGADPLALLRGELASYCPPSVPGLPRFAGGLVGYLGYDAIRYFEPSVAIPPHPDLPDAIFLLADTVAAFDHAFHRLLLIANEPLNGDAAAARGAAEARLDELQARLGAPLPIRPHPAPSAAQFSMPGATPQRMKTSPPCPPLPSTGSGQALRGEGDGDAPPPSQGGGWGVGRPFSEQVELRSNVTAGQFAAAVVQAKEHIAAGDIFQVVLSQRLARATSAAAFDIYRALRRLNPSPYMFFFDFANLAGAPPLQLIGASPEMHVRLEGRQAAIRPIAGTRPRGRTPAADQALAAELLADPKERAEHVMLVDLARNDLGRVCTYGSVQVSEMMGVERYSHVMHIVSHVEGQLRPEYDAFDLLRATFPAGTVSGAPKIRAMQIIAELERQPRGPYAGAVGYFSYDGSADTCIAIRTLVMRGQEVSVQAGAGIVADSEPEREYQETLNKAQALATAVRMAETAAG